MKTVVSIPAGWSVHDDGAQLCSPDGKLRVEVAPPQPRPLDPAAFVRELVTRVEPGRAARLAARRSGTTACGWAFDQLDCVVTDGPGGSLEGRLVTVFHFLGFVAVVTASCRDPQAVLTWRDDLEALVRSARPDWRGGELAALAELWA